MSTDLTTDESLNSTAQFVKDQDGNASSLALSRESNVGIGTTEPENKLDVNGAIGIKSPALGQGVVFTDTNYSFGDGSQRFRLQRNFESTRLRIFEVVIENDSQKGEFFFDNVDVYPDDNNSQSLGKDQNQWSELHVVDGYFSGSVNFSNLPTPPNGLKTVDIVMDPATGKVYRKSEDEIPAPTGLRTE